MRYIEELPRAVTGPQGRRKSRLLHWLSLAGVVMILGYSVIFHFLMAWEGQSHSWATGIYWTITTMSTLGYGDVSFTSDVGRMFSMLVLVTGVVLLLILLPFSIIEFVLAPWMDAREAARTPRKVPPDMRNHIILAGLDAVTQTLIARAKRSKIPSVVIVEDRAVAGMLHDEGYKVVVGPLDSPQTYRNAGVDRALMVASTQEDTTNTNVAFTVRQISKKVTVAVTADKPASVDVLELAGADHVIQLGTTLGKAMASRVLGTTGRAHQIGSFGQTLIAEVAVRGTGLVGLTLREAKQALQCRVRILAVIRRGRLRATEPDDQIDDATILILAGSAAELARYDEQFALPHSSESPALILGGGRVGRAAAEAFREIDVPYTIVERIPGRAPAHLNVVEGDAAELENLEEAGLKDVSAALVTTHDDNMNVYLTLYCRRLRPDLQVVSRATHERNVATLYRAGADSVLSYATIGATILWNDLNIGHRVVIAEGNELFLVPRPPSLVNTSIRDASVHAETGCHIVAVTDDSGTLINDTEQIPADAHTKLMLLGDRHAERAFREKYLKKRR